MRNRQQTTTQNITPIATFDFSIFNQERFFFVNLELHFPVLLFLLLRRMLSLHCRAARNFCQFRCGQNAPKRNARCRSSSRHFLSQAIKITHFVLTILHRFFMTFAPISLDAPYFFREFRTKSFSSLTRVQSTSL